MIDSSEPSDPHFTSDQAAALLQWYQAMGADETISDSPLDRYAHSADLVAKRAAARSQASGQMAQQPPSQQQRQAPQHPEQGQQVQATQALVAQATALAEAAQDLNALQEAVRGFDGCPLKKTAMNTVFGEGVTNAKVMIIGDAPAADDDRNARPFSAQGPHLLDKMLHSIGLSETLGARDQVYLSNLIYWRPPGNRPPTQSEIAVCLPFVKRQIALVQPKTIILLGERAAHSLLDRQGAISQLRGRWYSIDTPSGAIETLVMRHTNELMRTPPYKRRAWQDLLTLKNKLKIQN